MSIVDSGINILQLGRTVQGEGLYSGFPIILLRTSMCNLRCSWCDTKYSWLIEGDNEHKPVLYHSKKLFREVKKLAKSDIKLLMITGGEPMLWSVNNEWIQFLRKLKKAGFTLHMETNGTIKVNSVMGRLIDFFDISPKVTLYPKLYSRDVVDSYKTTFHAWKFVVGDYTDFANILKFVREKYIDKNEFIVIMPEGESAEKLNEHEQIAKELIKNLKDAGYEQVIYSSRLQIFGGFL